MKLKLVFVFLISLGLNSCVFDADDFSDDSDDNGNSSSSDKTKSKQEDDQSILDQKQYSELLRMYQEKRKEDADATKIMIGMFKKFNKAVDVENEKTQDYAKQLASYYPGNLNIGQICKIFDHVVYRWKYVEDPRGIDEFCAASRTIKNKLAGDCDDFAILMTALIESIGGTSRISCAYPENGEAHAFAEVYVCANRNNFLEIVKAINNLYYPYIFDIYYTKDKNGGHWLNMDWWGEPKHPGGKYIGWAHRIIFYPREAKPTYDVEDKGKVYVEKVQKKKKSKRELLLGF